MKLNPYLNFGGNCAEAFQFYEKHLGGKITMMMRFSDQPDPKTIPKGMEDGVLYVNMQLAGSEGRGSDVSADRFQPMRSAYLSLGVDSDAEAEKIFALLSDGGEVFMPMEDTFFASLFAMLRDKFWTLWMIIHEKPMGPTP